MVSPRGTGPLQPSSLYCRTGASPSTDNLKPSTGNITGNTQVSFFKVPLKRATFKLKYTVCGKCRPIKSALLLLQAHNLNHTVVHLLTETALGSLAEPEKALAEPNAYRKQCVRNNLCQCETQESLEARSHVNSSTLTAQTKSETILSAW